MISIWGTGVKYCNSAAYGESTLKQRLDGFKAKYLNVLSAA